jgi:mycofactocin radical SAM maturase
LPQAKHTIDELVALGVFQVNIGGGEPFLHPDILAILEHCVARGLVTCVSTNGTTLSEITARRLAALGVRVQVSLDGVTAESNDAIRGGGTFQKALHGLALLSREEIKLAVNVVLTRTNADQLDEMLALARRFDAKLRISRFRPSGRGTDSWARLRPTEPQLQHLTAWLGKHPEVLTGDSFFFLNINGRDPYALDGCGAGSLTCCIAPDGALYPCAFLQSPPFLAGKIGEKPLIAIWRDAPVLQAFRKGSVACIECPLLGECGGGCPAVSYGATGTAAAIDPECPIGQHA